MVNLWDVCHADHNEMAGRAFSRGECHFPHWRLAFQGNLHEIPLEDYEGIAGLMRKAIWRKGWCVT